MIPHPQRVLFPRDGITRENLVQYYEAVAVRMLPSLRGRAITVRRWPHGIDDKTFYQKHPISALGVADPHRLITIDTTDELLQWVALGTIEFHAPLGLAAEADRHDWAVIDLDPNPPAGWTEIRQVARIVSTLLCLLDIPYLVKTSGGTGLHFYMRIAPTRATVVTAQVEQLAQLVVQSAPELATLKRQVRQRGPRVYIDYLQNGGQRTMAAVYSIRARDGAPVSCPIKEAEIFSMRPEQLNWQTAPKRQNPEWKLPSTVDLGQQLRKAGIPSAGLPRRGRLGDAGSDTMGEGRDGSLA